MTIELTRPLALVVGGGHGVGLEVARRMAGDLVQLHLLGGAPDALADAAETITQRDDVVTHKIDLGCSAANNRLVGWIDRLGMPIARLVIVTSEGRQRPLLELDRDEYRGVTSAGECRFFLIQAVARNMVQHGGGAIASVRVLPTSSTDGHVLRAADRFGLHEITESLSSELEPLGVSFDSLVLESPQTIPSLMEAWRVAGDAVAGFFQEGEPRQASRRLLVREVDGHIDVLPYPG